MTLMATRRITLSFDERVLALVREAAAEEGKSVSAWLNQVTEAALRRRAGLRAMDEYEAEHGAFTQEEIRKADELLDRLGVGRDE
jgi:hypothetical protein